MTPKEEILYLLDKAFKIAYAINGSDDVDAELELLEEQLKEQVELAAD